MSLDAVLAATERRTEDLRRTLASFDPGRATNFAEALLHFETCSQQLGLLLERGTEASADALLERHFVVPSAISGLDAPLAGGGVGVANVPMLLSTMLDKEQEDDYAATASSASGTAATRNLSKGATAHHNRCLDEAHAHLMKQALAVDLPGAANLQGATRRFVRSEAAAPPPNEEAAGAVKTAVTDPSAHALLSALRRGEGMQPLAVTLVKEEAASTSGSGQSDFAKRQRT